VSSLATADLVAVQARTLRVLTASQVLGGVGTSSGIAVGGLLAAELAHAEVYAGVAQTCSTVGAALLAVPVSRLMSRSGRRVGLVAAYGLAGSGAAVAVLAAVLGSAPLMLAAMLAFGAGNAANLQARYAAADLASAPRRGRALSVVVWATTVGAVLGPNLADPGGRLASALGLRPLAGSFLFSIASFALAGLVVASRLRPDPLLTARAALSGGGEAPVRQPLAASLRVIGRSAGARLGLLAVAVAHTVMVGVMVMTPVHMGHGGSSLRVIGLVVSVHILGMYAFAPAVGALSDRYGRRPVIGLGAVLQVAATLVAATAGLGALPLGVGLFLLGVGWSCGLVAGSTLLTESVPVPARPGVQGAADLVMGLSASAGGLVAGAIVGSVGYAALNVVAALVAVPVLVTLAHRRPPVPD
jgi:MFS family permease